MRLNDGWECEVYSFDLGFTDKGIERKKPMILRIFTGRELPGLEPKAVHEFNLLYQLAEQGYPVPQVYLLECGSEHLGSPFIVMERIEGEVLGNLYARVPAAECETLFREQVELLVDLHKIDWRVFVGGDFDATQAVMREIVRLHELAIYAGADYALPAIAWLKGQADQVSLGRLSLAHLDFHADNIITDKHGSHFVIDWARAEVTDHRFDLAWSTLFLSATCAARFLELYGQFSGDDLVDLDFFLAFVLWRRILVITISLEHGAAFLGMRPGAETLMRQHKSCLASLYAQWVAQSGVRVDHVERVIHCMEAS